MTNILNTTTIQAISFLLFLAALPLVSFGTMEDQELLWYAGLVLLLIAGILPPLGRFVVSDDGDEDDEEAPDQGDQEDQADEADRDDDASDASDADDVADGEGRDDAPHSAGPIGRGAGSAGRETERQRVQEQAERSSSEHSSGEDDR